MILDGWETILQAGPQLVGGKAWNLACLARYGLAVPPGQVITVHAYRRWLEDSKLENELLAAARDAARLTLSRNPSLEGEDGARLRLLLYLFERDDAVRLMRAG